MPFDNSFDDSFKRLCIGWELKFSFMPRKCFYTKKSLWLTWAYMGTSMLTGPGDAIFDHRWVDRKVWLLLRIKGTV